ncbi:SDR family NAD(P)-dependent oxidoreductase [Sulfurovum sp. zt1-1]|uniref:SDR family NAD(P)-dependent oxidoreductase n=1 Tax=Sulfurovum zhangzhouensis TaxID=3019067 RepID=A0ABT7QZH0_9BACT|nr:SDR family NAD(P)-dependent oxidoreductase [Sulfurovum zhangzhouensis]MDM5271929.1 SDR family NAD(P)-dependent oxidoreductase [Sulfurovum zhangzhouensis]
MTNIVITGCSTGIGLETALYLKERYISVYPTARDEKAVEHLKTLGFEHAMVLDVTKPEQISAVISKVVELEGKIDVWFNNAGFGQPGAVEDLRTELLREQFETNVFGLHECTIQVLKVMREQGYGKIIQHSSVLGLISLFGRGAYNASKYAIEGLTDTLRLELMDTDIHVSLLNTGPISSNFRQNAMQKLGENIDIDHSRFKEKYEANINEQGKKVPFKLEADAVASIVYEIIAAKKPKPRYYITKATYLLGNLKRVLSTSLLDKILHRVG